MKVSLINVKKALKGLIVMSEELEQLSNSLFDNMVPKMWEGKGFLSLKALSSWTQDLNDRINFLTKWIDHGTPNVFWISGRMGFLIRRLFLPSGLHHRHLAKLRQEKVNCYR
jgi:dynein heavy chain